jgi:hypothetical protein
MREFSNSVQLRVELVILMETVIKGRDDMRKIPLIKNVNPPRLIRRLDP